MVDGLLIGRLIRASRVRMGFRQEDVARTARVSRDVLSDVENGRAGSVRIDLLERIAGACGLRLRLDLLPTRADLARTRDVAHAELVERIVSLLEGAGWAIALEAQTRRGSIDVLAFHSATRMLLVIEVKSRLTDLQEMLRALARVTGEAPRSVAGLGWDPRAVSILLVVGDTSTQRRVIERHRSTFAAAFPLRTREIRRWLAAPVTPVRGLMFLPYARRRDVMQYVAIRVRRPRAGDRSIHARPRVHASSRARGSAPAPG